jgi:hypothetical protein
VCIAAINHYEGLGGSILVAGGHAVIGFSPMVGTTALDSMRAVDIFVTVRPAAFETILADALKQGWRDISVSPRYVLNACGDDATAFFQGITALQEEATQQGVFAAEADSPLSLFTPSPTTHLSSQVSTVKPFMPGSDGRLSLSHGCTDALQASLVVMDVEHVDLHLVDKDSKALLASMGLAEAVTNVNLKLYTCSTFTHISFTYTQTQGT